MTTTYRATPMMFGEGYFADGLNGAIFPLRGQVLTLIEACYCEGR